MKKYFKVFAILIILLGVLCNFSFAIQPQLAPDFRLHSLKGDAITLGSFRNSKPVLLLFWTTWCSFCRDQLIWMQDKYPEYAKQGLELLAINIGESPDKVEKFISLRNLSFTFLLDQDSSVADSFSVMGVPTYVLIDKDGRIISTDNSFPERKLKDILSK